MGVVNKQQEGRTWRDEMVAILPRLRRFALSLTGSMEDAEDLLHSTVERALLKSEKFQDDTDLDKWMFRICKNLWIDEWRSRKVRGPSVDPEDVKHEPSMDGESHAENTVQLQELAKVLSQLQEEYRSVLVLVVIEGYSYKEVSGMLDIPTGTVMSRLARARKKVAEMMPKQSLKVGDKP